VSQSILVTGGAGFIGSHLIERLVSAGHDVRCVDNFDNYYAASIKARNLSAALASDRANLVKADIRRAGTLMEIFRATRPTAVVHLAARPGVRQSLTNPRVYFDNNLLGTLNVLKAARATGVKRVVLASTSSVYGTIEGAAKEDETPCRPLSPYGASKVAAEALCSSFAQTGSMSILALRFFTVVGPRQRPDMAIAKFTRSILAGTPISIYGDGSSMRDYTYVSDIVSGVEAAVNVNLDGYQVVNIGRGNPVALNQLIMMLESTLGKAAKRQYEPMHPGDPQLTFADISKAKKLLDYEPTMSIEDATHHYVAWYMDQIDD
jgi:UDP-glucuronate 4-epimerase